MSSDTRTCPDCNATLIPIQVLGEVPTLNLEPSIQRYTDVDAQRSLITGGFKITGTIEWLMCSDCHRVLAYAVPLPDRAPEIDPPLRHHDTPSPQINIGQRD